MKIILTENKFIGVIQKLIDYHLKNLQELEESGAECPNDISDSVWGDFQSIDEIKVVDLQQTNFTITDMQVFIVTVNVVYNSVGGINIDEIIYNLEYLCKNTSGLRLNFSVNESINKHRENGNW